MAKRDEQQRKLELLDQLSRQRAQITSQKSSLVKNIEQTKVELKEKINVPKLINTKIKSSFSNSPTKWFVGSAVGGLFISKILFGRGRRKKRSFLANRKEEKSSSDVPRGLLMSAAFYFGKPMLKSYAIRRAKEYIANKYLLKYR